jgi:hypothetical protein
MASGHSGSPLLRTSSVNDRQADLACRVEHLLQHTLVAAGGVSGTN